MEVLKSVEDIFPTFQLFMLKLQAKNSQNQNTTPTSSQTKSNDSKYPIVLNQPITTAINENLILQLPQLLTQHNIIINSITNIIEYVM